MSPDRLKLDEADEVARVYSLAFPGHELTELFIETSVRVFLKRLPPDEVLDAMRMAVLRIPSGSGTAPSRVLKYFCGICWGKIKAGA